MPYIKVYTEKSTEDTYPASLANSVHFAMSEDGQIYEPMHNGYGILFAEADISDQNTILERGVKNPRIRKKGAVYHIWADRVDKEGEPLFPAEAVLWKTRDFLTFSEQICVRKKELGNRIPGESGSGLEKTDVPEAGRTAEISEDIADGIRKFWFPIYSEKVILPKELSVGALHEVVNVLAEVVYSDGSMDAKNVTWDFAKEEKISDHQYRIKGRIDPGHTGFPLASGYADPVIFQYEDSWYFLATNDNADDIGLFVRKAGSVRELFAETTKEYCILPYDEAKGFCRTFWAPEFHIVGGEPYIFFAVSGASWGPQCHMMKLKKDGQVCRAEDWETPVMVTKADGTPIGDGGISLDMTYIPAKSGSYVCWSYRQHIGTPDDTGSMLYIAKIDEKNPWQLASEPVLLSRPLYGWENNSGTINNEGPYALLAGGKVYLAFSGGAACGYSYAVGYLIADGDKDLLDVSQWTKMPTAMLSSFSVPGIEGPGHNSFFEDEDGKWYIAYHGQDLTQVQHKRCTAYHRVHFSADGFPMLNVVEERDVAPQLREVELTVTCHDEWRAVSSG